MRKVGKEELLLLGDLDLEFVGGRGCRRLAGDEVEERDSLLSGLRRCFQGGFETWIGDDVFNCHD